MEISRIKNKAKIRRLLEALHHYKPEYVYLFGSWAREEEDELSDLDIVIIKQTTLPFFERLREVGNLLPPEIALAVDFLVYTPNEFAAMLKEGNAFAEMIAEEGRIIYAG